MATSKNVFHGTGRRKTAICQAQLTSGKGELTSNWPIPAPAKAAILHPLTLTGQDKKLNIRLTIIGGGVSSRIDAIRLAISRALLKSDEAMRVTLRKDGLLTRDARERERKKPGLRRARRAPQWAKR